MLDGNKLIECDNMKSEEMRDEQSWWRKRANRTCLEESDTYFGGSKSSNFLRVQEVLHLCPPRHPITQADGLECQLLTFFSSGLEAFVRHCRRVGLGNEMRFPSSNKDIDRRTSYKKVQSTK